MMVLVFLTFVMGIALAGRYQAFVLSPRLSSASRPRSRRAAVVPPREP
jgi:hypothetical protein